ncbi:MAG: 16S rRNA (guanine(966)-N(2))-methyltransferase RsmD [Dehalococcoidia bacterium]|nr:16S rRNA (guanine(966)-N(2))-methyltransferase RsmD [Dehalococcoidia bacterium]
MRVIAGKAKGHSLRWPKDPHIRPTIDLVRGAIFSALESLSVDWSHALDLYAGSGALGIEALSRGAEEVDFVERNHNCCSIIKENLKHTRLAERSRVYRMEARKALRTLEKQYTLIFLDPPYSDRSGHTMLGEVANSSLAGRQTTIVMEHSQQLSPEETCGKFHMIRRLRHGDTCVSIYQFAGGED